MQGQHTVTINGRQYDAATGMPAGHQALRPPQRPPLGHSAPSRVHRLLDITPSPRQPGRQAGLHPSNVTAGTLHQPPQHSQTLARSAAHRPDSVPKPAVLPAQPAFQAADTAIARAQTQLSPAVHTSKELKELLIKERLAEVAASNTREPAGPKHHHVRSRLLAVAATTMAVLLLGGYFAFLNLPNLSLRVAASQAGIAANFPGYTPVGYNFAGPIAYSPGAVAMNFKSVATGQGFTLKQSRSTWNSQSVLADYVSKQTDAYLTYQDNGVTIYSYGNSAVWVNSGLLYTLDGDAHLTSDQVLNIANSL